MTVQNARASHASWKQLAFCVLDAQHMSRVQLSLTAKFAKQDDPVMILVCIVEPPARVFENRF